MDFKLGHYRMAGNGGGLRLPLYSEVEPTLQIPHGNPEQF